MSLYHATQLFPQIFTSLLVVTLAISGISPPASAVHTAGSKRLEDFYVKHGYMSRSVFERMDGITTRSEEVGCVSNSDLAWLILTLHSKPPSTSEAAVTTFHLRLMTSIEPLKRYAPGQKELIFNQAAWLCSSHYHWDKVTGILAFLFLKDEHATSILKRLTADRSPEVQMYATRVLKDLRSK